jgi:transcriptional regulator with PAS, ATPase and Fis domain
MEYLDLFSLKDVFIAATGLIIASIMRIYYDSYIEKKKIKRFSRSLTVYNSLVEDNKDGLLIISNNNEVIYSNNEATKILNTNRTNLDTIHLSGIGIEYENNSNNQSLLETIYSKNYIANANIMVKGSKKLPVSLSINKVSTSSQDDYHWYAVVLRDMTSICELRDGTRDLLASA